MDKAELQRLLKEEQARLGRIGGKTAHKNNPEHGKKLAERMNHVKQMKWQTQVALDLGETPPKDDPIPTKGVKQNEAKKTDMLYEP